MGKRRLRNVFQAAVAVVLSISLLVPAVPIWAAEGENVQYDSIDGLSGEILYDTSGNRVMACGGEVRQFTEDGVTKWYWFGVDDLEKAEGEQKVEGIHLYSSSDLYNWDYEGVMWDIEGSAHPKLLYNEAQKQYVMWVSNTQGKASIGTSGSIKGPFTPVSDSGTDSIQGFFNLYEEKPGTAYVIYSGSAFAGFSIARLSDDYQSVAGTPQPFQFEGVPLINTEGGIFKRDNKYYMVNAGMTQYAVADSLTGTWKVSTLQMWDGEAYKDIVDKNQTSSVCHVKTETGDEYVCIGDSVGGESGEVRYIWLPIEFFSNGTIALRELSNWKLDKKDEEGNQQLATETDIRALEEQISDAGSLLTETNKAKDENAYNILKAARDTAETVKNIASTTEVTKAQVTGATAALQEAIAAFNNAMTVADARILLAAAIAKANGIMDQEQNYTPGSWQAFVTAYEAARTIAPTAETDEISEAAANLTAAQGNLVLAVPVWITGVSLDKTALSIKIGETAVLEAAIEPVDTTIDETLLWISDRTDIAKVNQEGTVTGVRAGTANIIVRTSNGKKAVCTVTVTAPVEETPPATDVKISLDKTQATLAVGTDITLQAAVSPVNASAVVWSSSDDKIAAVKNGKVMAKKAGTAGIMATVGNRTASCTVTVVSLNKTKLVVGEKESVTLKVDGTNKDVAWSTSDKRSATVRNGKVTARKANKKAVTITADVDGASLTCKVTVKAAPKKLIFKGKKTITVNKNKTARLKVSLPKDTAGTLEYKSSNKKVAIVDSEGKVKGIRKGTAKITITAANNRKAKVTVTVKVK